MDSIKLGRNRLTLNRGRRREKKISRSKTTGLNNVYLKESFYEINERNVDWRRDTNVISNFRRVVNVVFFLSGDSPAS